MEPLQNLATGVLADVIRRQPSSPERTRFAWQLAVGPALARATSVSLQAGILSVRPRDPRWIPEVTRAADTILKRMQQFLGSAAVTRIAVDID